MMQHFLIVRIPSVIRYHVVCWTRVKKDHWLFTFRYLHICGYACGFHKFSAILLFCWIQSSNPQYCDCIPGTDISGNLKLTKQAKAEFLSKFWKFQDSIKSYWGRLKVQRDRSPHLLASAESSIPPNTQFHQPGISFRRFW